MNRIFAVKLIACSISGWILGHKLDRLGIGVYGAIVILFIAGLSLSILIDQIDTTRFWEDDYPWRRMEKK